MNNLSHETPSVQFNINHLQFLEYLRRYHPEEIRQNVLCKSLGWSKAKVSRIKIELMHLGWCKDVDLGVYTAIRLSSVNTVTAFLNWWKKMKRAVILRPNNIKYKGFFIDKPSSIEQVFQALLYRHDPSFSIKRSKMTNNVRYTISTPYGTIVFFKEGNAIEYWVKNIALAVEKEDIDSFEEYLIPAIEERAENLLLLLQQHLSPFKIHLSSAMILNRFEIGIVLKKEIYQFLNIQKEIYFNGLFADGSVRECKEIESKGYMDKVLEKTRIALNIIFNNEAWKQLAMVNDK